MRGDDDDDSDMAPCACACMSASAPHAAAEPMLRTDPPDAERAMPLPPEVEGGYG